MIIFLIRGGGFKMFSLIGGIADEFFDGTHNESGFLARIFG